MVSFQINQYKHYTTTHTCNACNKNSPKNRTDNESKVWIKQSNVIFIPSINKTTQIC